MSCAPLEFRDSRRCADRSREARGTQTLCEGVQRAENPHAHGVVDMIVMIVARANKLETAGRIIGPPPPPLPPALAALAPEHDDLAAA